MSSSSDIELEIDNFFEETETPPPTSSLLPCLLDKLQSHSDSRLICLRALIKKNHPNNNIKNNTVFCEFQLVGGPLSAAVDEVVFEGGGRGRQGTGLRVEIDVEGMVVVDPREVSLDHRARQLAVRVFLLRGEDGVPWPPARCSGLSRFVQERIVGSVLTVEGLVAALDPVFSFCSRCFVCGKLCGWPAGLGTVSCCQDSHVCALGFCGSPWTLPVIAQTLSDPTVMLLHLASLVSAAAGTGWRLEPFPKDFLKSQELGRADAGFFGDPTSPLRQENKDMAQIHRLLKPLAALITGDGSHALVDPLDLCRRAHPSSPLDATATLKLIEFSVATMARPIAQLTADEVALLGGVPERSECQVFVIGERPSADHERFELHKAASSSSSSSSCFVWHGSGAQNWFSILRNNVAVTSNTAFMRTGAAFGKGVYCSDQIAVSMAYSHSAVSVGGALAMGGKRWIGLFEAVVQPGEKTTHFVIKDASRLRQRFLILFRFEAERWVLPPADKLKEVYDALCREKFN
jgi:hypothetical protein